MAEAVVDFVSQKLQDYLTGPGKDALVAEGQFLIDVNGKVDKVKRELGMIRSFLKDADSKSSGEERVRNWVKEVRNVAYSIEDSIDTFQAEVDWITYKEPGFVNLMKRIFKKTMILPALHTLGNEMDGVEARIKEISADKNNYGINSLQDGSSKLSRPLIGHLIHPDIGDVEVVGFKSEKVAIIGQLLDKSTSRRSVVSIVGPGGIGKTTLAKAIYKDAQIKKQFDVLIWVSVTQEFNQIDLLKRILEKLQPADQRNHHTTADDDLITEIHASLKEKQYLVVADDIWDEELWSWLERVLPDDRNGSRFLDDEQSTELLLKKAFPDEKCPESLLDLAKEFAKKCGGLPLQLEVLGGLLSRKTADYSSWSRFMQTMDWFTDGKKCIDIIETSYEHLPSNLKSCFMSFSVFPEDYEINAQSLISYWCVEGFISQDGRGSMYAKAQDYLADLAQRCMVKVTRRNSEEVIERCRVHTLLRNLAVYKAKEKSFTTVYWKQEDYKEQPARHASFHFFTPDKQNYSTENKEVMDYTGPNVRSVMFFGNILPIQSRMKLVKVLIVYRATVTFSNGRHTWLRNLIGLRHLEFRECELENNTLPEEIHCLHRLEYLDLTDTTIRSLPESIKNNTTLTLVANRDESKA